MSKTCTVLGCRRKRFWASMCKKHWMERDRRMRLKSDNLKRADLSPSQEANLCALVRNLR